MNDIDLIYLAALERTPEDRPAYLAEACGGNHELRARVEKKLAMTAAAEAFIPDLPDDELEEPEPRRGMFKTFEPDRPDLADEVIGQNIGRYNILERLGEGGYC